MAHENDGELVLHRFETFGVTQETEYDLGDATDLEVFEDRVKFAIPSCPNGLPGRVLVGGRMEDPTGLSIAGVLHIARSNDNGASWSVVVSNWDLDHCGSLLTVAVPPSSIEIFAIRSARGSYP